MVTSGCFKVKGTVDIPKLELFALKNVNNCLNTNIYFYLETSGGKSFNLFSGSPIFMQLGFSLE